MSIFLIQKYFRQDLATNIHFVIVIIRDKIFELLLQMVQMSRAIIWGQAVWHWCRYMGSWLYSCRIIIEGNCKNYAYKKKIYSSLFISVQTEVD